MMSNQTPLVIEYTRKIIAFIDHLLSNYYPFTPISRPMYFGSHFRGQVIMW